MIALIANNELKRTWREAVVEHVQVMSWHLSGGTEKDHKYVSRIVGLSVENLIPYLANMMEEC